jgi:predicted phosphodiesterase
LRIQVSDRANPWTHLNLYNDPNNFQFAIVSDRSGHIRPSVFESAVDKLNLLKPEFVISVGDFIDGFTEDNAELDHQWNDFEGLVKKLQMPFFYVPGNHDISNEMMTEKWRKRLGRTYYHFVYRNVLFLCVDTMDPPKWGISDNQIEYFQEVLEANRNVRWTLVFMHQPAWKGESQKDWEKLERLLAHRPYTVFAGHLHTYSKSIQKGHRYYVLASTGGGGKGPGYSLLGLEKCQFDHIVWVTITDDGPVIANLLLEGILNDEPCSQHPEQEPRPPRPERYDNYCLKSLPRCQYRH